MKPMYALTIWQPWAALIMVGAKPYEFRRWHAPAAHIGQRIVIHAGVRPIKRTEMLDLAARFNSPAKRWSTGLNDKAGPVLDLALSQPGRFVLGAGLGTALLGKPRRDADLLAEFGQAVNDSDRDRETNWGWPLTGIEHFEPPIMRKGAQGFWLWSGA